MDAHADQPEKWTVSGAGLAFKPSAFIVPVWSIIQQLHNLFVTLEVNESNVLPAHEQLLELLWALPLPSTSVERYVGQLQVHPIVFASERAELTSAALQYSFYRGFVLQFHDKPSACCEIHHCGQ